MSAAAAAALLASATVVVATATRPRSDPDRRPGPQRHASVGRTARRMPWPVVVVLAVSPAIVVVAGAGPAVLVAVGVVLLQVERRRRAERSRRRAQDGAFPDLVDLFRIAAAAGHPVPRCLAVVAARAPTSLRRPLGAAVARSDRGAPLAEVLEELGPELGSSGPVLTDALRSALRTGSPLVPVLDQVAAVARDRRTRSAQAAARRLPVRMLFPLVCCVLPAFGLLAVVPLLAGSIGSLAP